MKLTIHPAWANKFQVVDLTDSLPRKQRWEELKKKYRVKGVWDNKTYHTGFRDPKDISTAIVHHSGSPEGTLESHARYHAGKWGAGIAYHVSIDVPTKSILQLNDLRSFTYHAGGHNTYTVGVLVNRDLTKRDMSDEERELLYVAIMSIKQSLNIVDILGHNEVQATECPGTSMNRIRSDIQNLIMQLEFEQTKSHKSEVAHAIGNQILYMLNLMKGKDYDGSEASAGKVEWATNRMMELYPFMKERGLVK